MSDELNKLHVSVWNVLNRQVISRRGERAFAGLALMILFSTVPLSAIFLSPGFSLMLSACVITGGVIGVYNVWHRRSAHRRNSQFSGIRRPPQL